MNKPYTYKVRIAYHIVETREFEFQSDLPFLSPEEVMTTCEEDIGFDKGKIVDREILRENLVYQDWVASLPNPLYENTHQIHGEK